ncbi:glucokinase [Natronobacillus azotifigens]|uniref:Glucokinase n=1 Tax=Natronobacillus azotifigens TaxID=472978 RepID=A0A9J6RF43_9BACI|nr:ROK family glucokinase [Natronobacillus azotifigens]MCZ0704061.1 ROK family glucokinase [Natronobacillus azotifigens]
MSKFLLGVDIGGTTVKIGVIQENGDIIEKWEILTNISSGATSIPSDIWTSIEGKLVELNIDNTDIIGIGVGAPGFVQTETGIVAEAVNLGWKDFKLADKLNTLSNLPVYVDNDANIAALGENWKGSGQLADNLIAVTLGTGVGGGIIANGQIVSGTNGTAGEIGHMTVLEDGVLCNCGRRGCLETITSATGIARLAEEKVTSGVVTNLQTKYQNNNNMLTAKDVFDSATEGDEVAIELVLYVTDVLGLAISNIATIINPSKIVIGGGVSKAGEALLSPLRKAFTKYALPRIDQGSSFVIAELGNDAGIIGGAYLVKQNMSV